MEFEEVFYLKKILTLLKQLSRENLFIHSDDIHKGIHFSTVNLERTAILDVFLKNKEKKSKTVGLNKFSFKTSKLFFDLMDTLEKGSTVNLDFDDNKFNINISYDDIELNSTLKSEVEDFIGFPPSNKRTIYKISGEKMAHALNLLSKFRSDFEVIVVDKNLLIKSTSPLGNTELIIPATKSNKKKKDVSDESVYDYEIIKPLLSLSKLSDEVKIIFQWNDNIEDNVLIVEGRFIHYTGYAKYLFTPKGAKNELS